MPNERRGDKVPEDRSWKECAKKAIAEAAIATPYMHIGHSYDIIFLSVVQNLIP